MLEYKFSMKGLLDLINELPYSFQRLIQIEKELDYIREFLVLLVYNTTFYKHVKS
jgi:hypothetical protein